MLQREEEWVKIVHPLSVGRTFSMGMCGQGELLRAQQSYDWHSDFMEPGYWIATQNSPASRATEDFGHCS